MVEVLQILTPALSALVGGLLAILGGQLVQRKNVADENRKFLREKIQESYEQIIETEDWFKQEIININLSIFDMPDVVRDKLKSKSKHVRMLLGLYFKNSHELCEEFVKYETLYFETIALIYTSATELQECEKLNKINESFNSYLSITNKIKDFLIEEMQKLAKIS